MCIKQCLSLSLAAPFWWHFGVTVLKQSTQAVPHLAVVGGENEVSVVNTRLSPAGALRAAQDPFLVLGRRRQL